MKNLKRTVFQYYLLNFFIILDLALIAKTFSDQQYFLTLFISMVVLYMIYRMNAYYIPMYKIAKKALALNRKVDNYLENGTAISAEERAALHEQTENIRKEFEEIVGKKFTI